MNTNAAFSSDDCWRQLDRATAARWAQDQILWSMFGHFWAVNALFLIALFSQGDFPDPEVGAIISVAGMLVSLAWLLMQRRGLAHMERFETLVLMLEKRINIPDDLCLHLDINEDAYKALPKPPVRRLMRLCSLSACVVWLAAGVIWLAVLICSAG